jgi:dTDP-4-dehydrorhamnose 3,5-epimerase
MNVIKTEIPGVLILEPTVFDDERGFFYESYNERAFAEATGISPHFVQDNHSLSNRNVLRGLHYQIQQPQGKLVRVTGGEVFDVVVDIRRSSPTFGKYVATRLSAENKRMMWIPVGFAHGFLATSDHTEFLYKTTAYWASQHERCIAWNDARLRISWPLRGEPALSDNDRKGTPFTQAETFP